MKIYKYNNEMINKMLKVSVVIKRLISSQAQTFIFTIYLNKTQTNEENFCKAIKIIGFKLL